SPKTDPVAASRSLLIPYAGQTPRVMEGFTVTPFVTGLEHPRRLLVLPNNDVIVAEQRTGYLTLLRDQDGDGKADFIQRYADDFKAPRVPGRLCARCRSRGHLARAACQRRRSWRPPRSTKDHGRSPRTAQARAGGIRPGIGHAERRVWGNCGSPEPSPRNRSKNGSLVCRGRLRRQHRRGAGGQGLSSAVRSGRLRPNHVCLWNAQSDDPRIPPDYWRTLRRSSGAGRAWRQSSARLLHSRREGFVLRLALRLYRSQPAAGLCTSGAGQSQSNSCPRRVVPAPLVSLRPSVLRWRTIPGRVSRGCIRSAEGLLEPL